MQVQAVAGYLASVEHCVSSLHMERTVLSCEAAHLLALCDRPLQQVPTPLLQPIEWRVVQVLAVETVSLGIVRHRMRRNSISIASEQGARKLLWGGAEASAQCQCCS